MKSLLNLFSKTGSTFISILIASSESAQAHVSERAMVLLLPTEFYIPAGLFVLILTIFISYITPLSFITSMFKPIQLGSIPFIQRNQEVFKITISSSSFLFLILLIFAGINGSRDPLDNPLPLFIWTIWFMGMPIIQILFGNIWSFLNPWYGPAKIIFNNKYFFKLPKSLTFLPSSIGFFLFALLLLVDIAPDDPDRLAIIISLYWLINFFFIRIFGNEWLRNSECFTVFYLLLSKMSCLWIKDDRLFLGLFGSQLRTIKFMPAPSVFFLSLILATLSFDGLNETFWWFSVIDVNPLEFYGRSSVIAENTIGLIIFSLLLLITFSSVIYIGHWLTSEKIKFLDIIGINSISLLPIAIGYHIAHYLTSFIVNIQYALKVSTDPFSIGADYLNLGTFNVTTSFFNTIDTVKLIWFIQAGSIVTGHILAVLLAHAICENYLKSKKSVLISQFPVSIFMIGYTFLGLWILSSPTI